MDGACRELSLYDVLRVSALQNHTRSYAECSAGGVIPLNFVVCDCADILPREFRGRVRRRGYLRPEDDVRQLRVRWSVRYVRPLPVSMVGSSRY